MQFNHIGIFAKNLKEGKKYIYDIFDIKKVSKEFHDKEYALNIIKMNQLTTSKTTACAEMPSP